MLEINRRATPNGPQYSRASKCRWEATHQTYQTHGKRKNNLGKNTWNKSPLLNSSSVGQVQHQSWFPDMQSFYSRRSCAIQTMYKNTASLAVFRPLICSSMNVSILQIIFYCYKSQITFTCKRRNSGHLCTFFKASFSVLNQSLKLLGLRMKAKKYKLYQNIIRWCSRNPHGNTNMNWKLDAPCASDCHVGFGVEVFFHEPDYFGCWTSASFRGSLTSEDAPGWAIC